METKRQNIDPGNTNETTICMCTKWKSKITISKEEEKYKSYPKRYKTQNTENTR